MEEEPKTLEPQEQKEQTEVKPDVADNKEEDDSKMKSSFLDNISVINFHSKKRKTYCEKSCVGY